MNYRNILTIFILLASVVFVSVTHAQTYQELDAELIAAEKKFWETNLNPMYDKTVKEFDAGNYRKAIAEANNFLAYTPGTTGNFPVLRGRAHLEAFRSDPGSGYDFINARADFIDAIRRDPKEAQYQVYLGELFWEAHRGYEANRQFDKALELDPNSYRALVAKADVAYFALDYQGCVSAVKRWMAHPDYKKESDAWAYFRLGVCYASLGDQANAKPNFERALAIEPGWKDSWHYLAFLKDGYSCKKMGTRLPEKPFEAFAASLRSLSCANEIAGSLLVLAGVEKKDENLKYYGLMHESEAQRRLNKNEVSDTFDSKDAENFFREAKYRLNAATRDGKETDITRLNEILELLNRAIIFKYENPDILFEDVDVMAREMRAKLLLAHPDKQFRLLAWREQMVLSNIQEADLQMSVNGSVRRKPLYKNGADVKARLIRGLFYSKVKENYRAALTEFDSAVNTLEKLYVQSAFDTDVPLYAEPYWRKGDTLLLLGEYEPAYNAFERALKINSKSLEAQNGMKTLAAKNPQIAARANQGLANNAEKIARNDQQAKANEENALITEYNNLTKRISDLERQQRNVERRVAEYMNAEVAARVFMHRGLYDSCTGVINNHESFITSLKTLRNRASGKSPAVISQIDSQISSVKLAVDKLYKIRGGLVKAL